MSGALVALAAGVSLGLFQLLNRKASSRGISLQRGTLTLLVTSTAIFAVVVLSSRSITAFAGIPAAAYGYFAVAGLIHFVAGWNLLSLSQRRVGAGRTGTLIGTVPIFSAVLGALFFSEYLSAAEIAGILCVVVGVYLVSSRPSRKHSAKRAHGAGRAQGSEQVGTGADARQPTKRERGAGHASDGTGAGTAHPTHALLGSAFGLGTALCFSVSPVFLRFGLSHYGSPTLAVSIGLAAATLAYALLLAAGRVLGRNGSGSGHRRDTRVAARITLAYQLLAGVFIALGTWLRYLAVDMIPLALVTTLARISIPLVLVLSPIFLGGRLERVTPRVWIGAALILGGVSVVTLR